MIRKSLGNICSFDFLADVALPVAEGATVAQVFGMNGRSLLISLAVLLVTQALLHLVRRRRIATSQQAQAQTRNGSE